MLERNFDQLSLTHLKWDKLTTQVMRILARGSCVVAALDKYTDYQVLWRKRDSMATL